MINLKIPRAAYAAGWEVFRSGQRKDVVTDAVIDAAMPLAFAAELRELGEVLRIEALAAAVAGSDGPSGLWRAIGLIERRIVELDPEGLTGA